MVFLPKHQHDLHWSVWRDDSQQPFKDYRMTRLTFDVSALPFAAIMAMRQNAMDHQRKYPLATQAFVNDFYIDNGLDEEGSIDEAIKLWTDMQELFELGGFVLRKWKSSKPVIIAQIPHELVDSQSTHSLDIDHFTIRCWVWNGMPLWIPLTIGFITETG